MSKAANSNITAPDVPGGRTDDERCERLAGPAVGPEPAALFLPPGPQDIRIGRAGRDTPPPVMVNHDVEEEDELPEPRPTDVMVGDAGTYLVLSRLLYSGRPAHLAGSSLPYDIIAHGGRGVGLICLQVKSTARPPLGRYRFVLKRGFHRSAHGVFAYQAGDFDIAAFVSLALDRVLFRPFGRPTFTATPADFCAPDAERRSLRAALAEVRAWRRAARQA